MIADADAALREHGFSGPRLLGLARHVANDAARRAPYCSEETREALTSYLVEVGIKETLKYDASQSGDGYSFSSYLWDVLHRRVTDFYRRKSEGFGDRRHGNHPFTPPRCTSTELSAGLSLQAGLCGCQAVVETAVRGDCVSHVRDLYGRVSLCHRPVPQ